MSENHKNKGSKPPPPVPPRPSKSLIKEALAKTRQAHDIYLSSVPKSETHEKSPTSQRRNIPIDQVKRTNSFNKLPRKPSNITKNNERPVIYQSTNFKSKSTSELVTVPEKVSSNHDSLIVNGSARKISTPEMVQNSRLEIEHVKDSGSNKVTTHQESVSVISNGAVSLDRKKTDNFEKNNSSDTIKNRNHVNTLIDEMFASVLEVNLSTSTSRSSSTNSIAKDTESDEKSNLQASNNVTNIGTDRKVKFDDQQNHEYLINELQNMKSREENALKRHRLSLNSNEDSSVTSHDSDKIQTNDWYEVSEGKKVKMSRCFIKIDDTGSGDELPTAQQKIQNMSRMYGLPPLPKSLSGFNFMDAGHIPDKNDCLNNNLKIEHCDTTCDGKSPSNLDKQLAILRREMDILREQDLFLLSKLWFLNESIQQFRQMLQDQEEKAFEDEDFYVISASTC